MLELNDGINANLRFEDILEGASNFLLWKVGVILPLEENDLRDIVHTIVTPSTNPLDLTIHKKKEMKSKWMIMDAIKDHLIPHISK